MFEDIVAALVPDLTESQARQVARLGTMYALQGVPISHRAEVRATLESDLERRLTSADPEEALFGWAASLEQRGITIPELSLDYEYQSLGEDGVEFYTMKDFLLAPDGYDPEYWVAKGHYDTRR